MSAQESVIIDTWTVPSGHQREMIDALRAAFEEFRLIDGFIEGGVLANTDDTTVASYVRVRSEDDWRSATEREQVREQIRTLESIGSSHADAYERRWVIAPPPDRGPVEVRPGSW